MIEIDGSRGGGQIIRTSSSLSAITKKPIRIKNIRGARPNPGLKEQHLKGIRGIKEITNGELKGDKKGSREIEFIPGDKINSKVQVNIRTAGSIGLILQQFQILALKKKIKLTVKGGGTHVKWSPPVEYISEIFLPLLKKHGYKGNIEIKKEGYYPIGGGEIDSTLDGRKLRNIIIKEKGKIKKINGISKASEHLKKPKVAERQKKAAERYIRKKIGFEEPEIKPVYVKSPSPGSGIIIKAETEKSIIGSDEIGEKQKSSEEVGIDASSKLEKELNSNSSVDINTADQLIPYMGYMEKESEIKPRKITQHIKTNIEVTEKMLNCKFKLNKDSIKCSGRGNI